MFVGDSALVSGKAVLILPCVGYGNIPQLATDIIIAALQLRRVGGLESVYVYPIAGLASNEPSSEIVTALDGM
jgi:uncharacterized metal-binding protein